MTTKDAQHLWKPPRLRIVSSFPETPQMIVCIEDEINRVARLSLVSKNAIFQRLKKHSW